MMSVEHQLQRFIVEIVGPGESCNYLDPLNAQCLSTGFADCISDSTGFGSRRCGVGNVAHGTTAVGTCSENGNCFATCFDGTLTWANNCIPFGQVIQ